MTVTLTERHWNLELCPSCGDEIHDTPPERCDEPRFRLLHWLAYLSESRCCASWHIDCQDVVLHWCERPRPDVEPWAYPGFCTVYASEAAAVLALVAEAGGEWRWDDADPCPRWVPTE